MSVQGLHPVAVVDNDLTSITRAHAGLDNRAVRGRVHRITLAGSDVDPRMKGAFPVKGIHTSAEGTGDNSLHRPERWRVRHTQAASQSCWESIREIEPVHDLPRHGRGAEGQKLVKRLGVLLIAEVVGACRTCRC